MNPPLLRRFQPDAIPDQMKLNKRWAPWRAEWNDKRKKYDKIPHRADQPKYGISTAKPEQWFSFSDALAAYQAHPDKFAGIGYCMTGPHGVVGIDLDNCVDTGVVAPWAQEVIDQVGSYAEFSPSGRGLRIMSLGESPRDWNNHEVGIEVYGGHEGRFLTITGAQIASAPSTMRAAPDGALGQLEARYAKEKRKADVIDLKMPELLDELLLPTIESLDIPPASREFLTEGVHGGDRSGALFSTAVALYAAGLPDEEVFSLLVNNPHAMEVALDHRRQDHDRALAYLWREHCCKGKARAKERSVMDDFVTYPPEEPSATAASRLGITDVHEYAAAPMPGWLIKKVLPEAGLAVLFGESGAGKSFIVIDMVCAIARGVAWWGHKVKQGRVVYVCAEGQAGFRKRMAAYAEYNGVGLKDIPLGVISDTPNLIKSSEAQVLANRIRDWGGASVIVMDTLAQVTAGANENSSEINVALDTCKRLHAATGALIILVAHSGKDPSKGVRGWSGIKGAADVQIEVSRAGDLRSINLSKQKEDKDGDAYGFKLEVVTLGEDEDGDPITSCIVVPTHEKPAAPKKDPKGSAGKIVMDAARTLLALDDRVSVNNLAEAAAAQMERGDSKRDQRKGRAFEAIKRLEENGVLSTEGGLVTLL